MSIEALKALAKKHLVTVTDRGDGTYTVLSEYPSEDDDIPPDVAVMTLDDLTSYIQGMEGSEIARRIEESHEYPSRRVPIDCAS